MNSVRYRVTNPWGLHARSSAFVASVAEACAKKWEVVIVAHGEEANAKSIIDLMGVAAAYGSEVEFFSLMPDENWAQFTVSLESLFFITDHEGKKANAYAPVERIIQIGNREKRLPCLLIQKELQAVSASYNCGPFFERIAGQGSTDQRTLEIRKSERTRLKPEAIDVFISYDSKDFSYAVSIYDPLIARGLNVFLAGASLARMGASDFQLAIEQALEGCRSMVLVASDSEHLEGGWVRAEWTTFLNEKRAGRKAGNLVTVRPEKLAVSDLPVMLRMFQSEVVPEFGPVRGERLDRLVEFLGLGDAT